MNGLILATKEIMFVIAASLSDVSVEQINSTLFTCAVFHSLLSFPLTLTRSYLGILSLGTGRDRDRCSLSVYCVIAPLFIHSSFLSTSLYFG